MSCKPPPFDQRDLPVCLEPVSVVDVALEIEVVVARDARSSFDARTRRTIIGLDDDELLTTSQPVPTGRLWSGGLKSGEEGPGRGLVQVPLPLCPGAHPIGALSPYLRSEHRPEPIPPEPHRLVAEIDPTLMKPVLDVPKR